MDKFELEKLRELPIEGVAERLGLQVSRHKALCPFHDDHHASLSFSVKRNTFRCFVCGASGGPIDLVKKYLNKDFLDACRWLADENNIILTEYKPEEDRPPKPFDAQRYERFFERPWLNDEARRFLFEERRLDPRVVRWCRLTSWKDKQGVPWLQTPYYDREGKLIGIQNRNLTPLQLPRGGEKEASQTPLQLPRGGEKEASLTPLQLPRGGEKEASLTPLSSPEGDQKASPRGGLEGVVDLGGSPRFRFPSGSECSIYNLPVLRLLRPGDELYITEGCSDCWAMLSSGHKAIAIPSATLLSRKDIELLKKITPLSSPEGDKKASPRGGLEGVAFQLPRGGEKEASPRGGLEGVAFHMFPDRDMPGERLFLQLKEVLPKLVRHQLPPDCKDYSEYYLKMKKMKEL